MTVNFTFDKAAVERRGRTLEDVHRTIKSLFAAHDLPCTADGDALSFKDKGHGDDFACMWEIIAGGLVHGLRRRLRLAGRGRRGGRAGTIAGRRVHFGYVFRRSYYLEVTHYNILSH